MSDWIRVRDNELDRELSIQRVQLPHGDYTEIKGEPALDHNDVPLPPRFAGDPAPVEDGYEARTVPELKDLIATRNAVRGEEDQIPAQGNKPDLIAALVADDTKENR